jgi:hypothetical protein
VLSLPDRDRSVKIDDLKFTVAARSDSRRHVVSSIVCMTIERCVDGHDSGRLHGIHTTACRGWTLVATTRGPKNEEISLVHRTAAADNTPFHHTHLERAHDHTEIVGACPGAIVVAPVLTVERK